MNLERSRAIQFLKAAYGLTVAPRELYLLVDDILQRPHLHRLKTGPSIWVLRTEDERGNVRVHGAVGSHVDDFLFIRNEEDPVWNSCLESFRQSLRWSPWEQSPMMQCGVHLATRSTWQFAFEPRRILSRHQSGGGDRHHRGAPPHELHQCRAVLGVAQWRCYQTGPPHSAKLSHLQSGFLKVIDRL